VKGTAGKFAVLLFRGQDLLSRAIRWQTRSVYSHAALLRPDGSVIEAWPGEGVRERLIEDWTGIDAFTIAGCTPQQWNAANIFARDHLGAHYDWLGVLRFVSRRDDADQKLSWFCSELVFASLQHAGITLLERIEPWAVSPGLLANSPLLTRIGSEARARLC